jgi:tRNA A-37 threonylcarbamoyl transferase component Bud32
MSRLNPILLTNYRRYARIALCVVIGLSLLVLLGWATNISDLMCLCPRFGANELKSLRFMGRVHATAALSMIVYSITLLTIMSRTDNRYLRLAMEALVGIIMIAVTVAAVVMGIGEDMPKITFYKPEETAVGISFPMPLSIEIGVDLALLGASILLLRLPSFSKSAVPPQVTPSQVAVIAAIPIPLLIVLAAATEIEELCALGGCFTMSTGFAVIALILCSAIFFAEPDAGIASMYCGTSTGSLILRRASTFLCTIPVLLILRTVLVLLPLKISQEVGWVIFVFLILVLAAAFILPGVKTFDRIESELSQQLNVTRDELEQTRQSRSAMMEAVGSATAGMTLLRYKRICLTCTCEFDDSNENCPNDNTPLARVIDDSLIGVVFADKYEILSMLGTGGMSTVYKARHKFLNKDVAIKVLKGNTASSSDGLKRFQREARATSAVSHPGIVGISDFGLSPDGRAFLVMDYLPGESLSEMLDRVGPLTLPMMVALGSQICEALAAAHQKGIVHRDLKPSNIMLVKNDDGTAQAKIVDFGLAKILEEDSNAALKITQTGECFGSPLYMSPEQCMGKKLDHRSDIYALGAILYELVTGYPPIMGQSAADTVRRQVTEKPSPIPQDVRIPNEVRLVIYKCLHKEASYRPQTAYEILDVLSRITIWTA